MSEESEKPNLGAMRDAASTSKEASSADAPAAENTKLDQEIVEELLQSSPALLEKVEPATAEPVALPAYFSVGELLPWKGRWLRLIKCDGDQIHFQLVKPTERATKLAQRRERWLKQHPKATRLRSKHFSYSPQGLSSAGA